MLALRSAPLGMGPSPSDGDGDGAEQCDASEGDGTARLYMPRIHSDLHSQCKGRLGREEDDDDAALAGTEAGERVEE
jgi:hypothetical protein